MLRNEGLKRVRMRLITAVIFVFTLTCSGSFGMEDVVSSSGPGMTLLMILILPLVWSVPMAFVASELGSMVPEAGGLYRWIRRGMGEYWSFQAGWWWTLSLYVDSAVYVALALDYMQNQWGFGATERALIGVGIVAVFTFINIRGLELTGWSLTIIQIGVMVPLLIFTVYGIIKGTGSGFSPMLPEGESFLTSLNLGLAIMMWMYSGWESMSTLAGEIQNPQKVIPQALHDRHAAGHRHLLRDRVGVHPHRQPRRPGQLPQHVDGRRRRGLRASSPRSSAAPSSATSC